MTVREDWVTDTASAEDSAEPARLLAAASALAEEPLVPTVDSARRVTLVSNVVWLSATRAMTRKAMSSCDSTLSVGNNLEFPIDSGLRTSIAFIRLAVGSSARLPGS